MAVHYTIWVPAVALAHAIAFVLALYSAERVTGVLSRSCYAITRPLRGRPKLDVERAESSAPDIQLTDIAPAGQPGLLECGCQGVCTCASSAPVHHVAEPVELAWSNLTCDVMSQKTHRPMRVLHHALGCVKHGQMMALVGPSGAGKSTLLDILAMRKTTGTLQGHVLCNGSPCTPEFRRIQAYVPQEDVTVPTMSAAEVLQFHAALRLGKSTTASIRSSIVEDVLRAMGLAKSRNTQVGGPLPGGISVRGLSGGERRRLTIACALVANPSVLFLDEPTTGLDAFAALNIMEHMARLASGGITLCATIHQPREAIWAKFHQVTLLSMGHVVYTGPPQGAVPWFKTLGYEYVPVRDGSASDWLIDLVSVGFDKPQEPAGRSMTELAHVQQAAELFHTSQGATKEAAPALLGPGHKRLLATLNLHWATKYPASWGAQFSVLFRRSVLAQLRNPTDATSRLLLSCWVGILAGLVFFDLPETATATFQRLGIEFFIILLFELLPFCYMSFYVADRKYFAGDVAAKLYHPSAYYMANWVAGLPLVVLNTALGAYAMYGLVGLRYEAGPAVLYGVIVVIQSLVAIQLMTACVYISPTQDLAYVLATGYVSLSLLVAGFFVQLSHLTIAPMHWLSFISYPRFAITGLSRLELHGVSYYPPSCTASKISAAQVNNSTRAARSTTGIVCNPADTGDHALQLWGLSVPPAEVIGILLTFSVVLHAISYLALSKLHKQKR